KNRFKKNLSDDRHDFDDFVDLVFGKIKKLEKANLKKLQLLVLYLLQKKAARNGYRGKSDFEKNVAALKRMFAFTDHEEEFIIFLFVLSTCEAAQEFWQNGELESALEALDKAYSLILTVEPDDPAKMVQQKEDLRFLISKRILEIYASRNIVVNGNHNAIPREINTNIQKEINLFTRGPEKNFFIDSYRRSGRYRPMILKKLEAAGLPAELSGLPLIESGFKVKALSSARALGLWQFIPSTGYKFGLKRDQYIDERIDFEKASDAAIAYLKELHSIFGDWSTVLAAYNCGEGRVLRVIRTQNINYLDDFWDLYGRLPFETARYVPRFLAALHVIENLEKYGMSDIDVYPALAFERVDVNRQIHLKDLASPLGTTFDSLKELNPELRYSVLPPTTYSLRVPLGKQDLLLASIDQVPVSSPPRPAYVYHRVRKGETLSTIARRYHTSVKNIMWANNLKRSSYIVAGKKLKIPQRGMIVTRALAVAPSNDAWNQKHVVKSGDSLWIIAKRYGTTTQQIQEMNRLSTTRLRINQVLKVPSQESASTQPAKGSGNYYVQRGDSPYIIARKYNMSLNQFLKINDLTPRSTIYPGQSVRIE
ncbi:LysM peptidoglycan-binding domain-containing protein, partial [Desulfosarcina sp.]|uniref:LysM peptidoglycan-binding domain-containing protein n=1 Tax=Desulfosarcina sp. TaxID=2027861 RepID=UPI003568C1DE